MVSKIGYGMAIPLHFLPNWNSILSTAYVYSGVGTFPYLMMLVITIYLKSTFLIAGTNSKMPHKYHIGILYLQSVLEYIDS